VLYALALVTATHWPKLELPALQGTDKTIHFVAFGMWTLFLWRTGWVRSRWLLMLIALVWSALDEWGQAIPVIHRHFSWLDMSANFGGVILATLVLALINLLRTPRQA